jgi:hypothetical protein
MSFDKRLAQFANGRGFVDRVARIREATKRSGFAPEEPRETAEAESRLRRCASDAEYRQARRTREGVCPTLSGAGPCGWSLTSAAASAERVASESPACPVLARRCRHAAPTGRRLLVPPPRVRRSARQQPVRRSMAGYPAVAHVSGRRAEQPSRHQVRARRYSAISRECDSIG